MTQPHTTSLGRQIWVVLLSYLTRTGFRWAIVSILSGFSLILIGVGCGKLLHLGRSDENPFAFLIMIGAIAIEGSIVAALILFLIHARQQLMGPTTRFMPYTRRANLIVAAGLFFTIIFAISWTFHDLDYFPGMLLVVTAFMILIACAVCNPWLIPLPATALLLLAYNPHAQLAALEITTEFNVATMFHDETPLRLRMLTEHEHYVWALRAVLLLLDILALIVLERISRPKRSGFSLARLERKLSALFGQAARVSTEHRRPFIQTRFARILHRRFAVHDWRAAVFLASVTAAITALLSHVAGPVTDPVIPIVATLVLLPGTLAAVGWRDRWGSYEFETLYPAKHRQFVSEMLFVLLLDMTEYWFACLAAVLLTIFAVRSQMLHDPMFWTAIAGSAMMQMLWIGGIALAGQRRRTLPFAAGLGVAALSMLVALDNLHRAGSTLDPSHFVAFSTIEMLAGFLFLAIATFVWRRRAAV